MKAGENGGCMCGAVRYQLSGDADFAIICQCRQCQHISGAGHAASFRVRIKDVTLDGDIMFYETKADDGNRVKSGFCPTCGNPILKKTSALPEHVYLHAATLDNPALFKPELLVYETSAQPWDYVDPSIKR